ncbi:MAG: hypothetical protein ABGY42_16150 [bacterium]
MKNETSEFISPLLGSLRANAALVESKSGKFLLGGRDFLHFHEEPGGIVADVKLSGGYVRLPVNTPSEQAELLDRIGRKLSVLDRHARARKQKPRRGRS